MLWQFAGDEVSTLRRSMKSTLLCAAAVMMAAPGVALAQGAPASTQAQASTDVDEVIVTARRREENVQDVPTSVTVMDQEAIARADITSVQELQYYVPSLNIQAQGNDYNYPPISIRGQGTYSPGATPAVASYINEVPVSATANAGDLSGGRYYDLQSVQVLKGPQGTLFGRNTTGGAILMTSQRPTNDAGGYGEVTLGSYDQRELTAAFNMPIIADKVLLRLAGQRVLRDGYARTLGTPSDPDGQEMGNRDIASARATLSVLPTERVRNDLILEVHHQNTTGFPLVLAAVDPNGFAELVFPGVADLVEEQRRLGIDTLLPISVDPMTKLRFWGATDIFEFDLTPDIKLRNIASYSKTEFSFQQDVDATQFPILDAPEIYLQPSERRQVTEEVQLQGSSFTKLDWIVGAFYLDDDQPDFSLSQSTIFGGTGRSGAKIGQSSRALYAQGTYDLSTFLQGLKFTAGYRYTWDERTHASVNGAGVETPTQTVEFSAPSWLLGLDYQFNEDTLFYLASRRGYRSGGYNAGAVDPANREFGPEFLTDVELGVKADWRLGGRAARTNLAFYYGWYEDIQLTRLVLLPSGTEAVTSNAGEANVYGAEFDGFVDLFEGLRLTGTASWYYEKFTKLLPGVDPAVAHYFPKYVPAYQINLGALYTLPTSPDVGEITLGVNYAWFSETSASLEFIPQPFDTVEPYGLVNLSADWKGVAGQPLDISAFVTNATDDRSHTGSIPFYYGIGLTTATYLPPRMAGVRLRYSF